MRSRRSSPPIPPSATPLHARARRACSRACCSTATHTTKKGTWYRYYVSRPLIANDQTDGSAGLRIPAAEIEQAVTSRIRQWLVDSGSVYQGTRLADPSVQRRL